MFRSSMISSSGSYLFISLSMLLILKIIKIFKSTINSSWLWQHMFSVPVTRTVWRREPDGVTGILNICCHNQDELVVLLKYFNNF
jgi:hypothetical protein